MELLVIWTAVIVLILFWNETKADCSKNVVSIGDSYFILTPGRKDAGNATQVCEHLEGTLPIVPDEIQRDKLLQFLSSLWKTDDIKKVWIKERQGHIYSYSLENVENTTHNWWPYKKIPSLQLYSKIWGSFTVPIWFGKNKNVKSPLADNWIVKISEDRLTNREWFRDFFLFGASLLATRTRDVYLFERMKGIKTTRLSYSHRNAYRGFTMTEKQFGVAEYLVFLGARSDRGVTDWTWNDGSTVNMVSLPNSSSKVCQQLTWYFDEKWLLLPKDCHSVFGSLVCQFKLAISISADDCDSSSLTLSWEPDMFDKIFSPDYYEDVKFKLQMQLSNGSWQDTPITEGKHSISNLEARTRYTVKVRATTNACDKFNLKTMLSVTTSYGVPEAVESATVSEDPDGCRIEWTHLYAGIKYEVKAYDGSQKLMESKVFDDASKSENENNYLILNVDPSAAWKFTIEAYTCQGRSPAVTAIGKCGEATPVVTVAQRSSRHNTVIGIVGTLAGLVAVGSAAVGFVFYKRRLYRVRRDREEAEIPLRSD